MPADPKPPKREPASPKPMRRKTPLKAKTKLKAKPLDRRMSGAAITAAAQSARRPDRVFNLRAKGENVCRNCGSRNRLQLHHAIPRSMGTAESKVNLLNGLPLCEPCHSGWHRRRIVITRSVFRPAEWSYLLSVKMTGRETAAWLDARYPLEPVG